MVTTKKPGLPRFKAMGLDSVAQRLWSGRRPSLVSWARVFCLGFALLTWTACEPQGPKALLEGEKLLEQERYNEAIRLLQLATEKLPRDARAWNFLGLAYHGSGLNSEAGQAYQKALALDHKLSSARYNLGCLMLEQDQPQLAITELTAFTLLQPRSSSGWLKLGSAQLRVSRLDAAETCFRNALKLVPKDPEALNGLGVIHVSRRKYVEAVQYFQIAIAESPNYGAPLLNQAIVTHRYLNQRATALQKYRQYLALQPRPENWDSVNIVAQALAEELAVNTKTPGAGFSTNIVLRTNATWANTPTATGKNPNPALAPPNGTALAGGSPKSGLASTKEPKPQLLTPPSVTSPAPLAPTTPVITEPPPAVKPSAPIVSVAPTEKSKNDEPAPPPLAVSEVAESLRVRPAQEVIEPKPAPTAATPTPPPAPAPQSTATAKAPATTTSPAPNAVSKSSPPSSAKEERPGFFSRLNPFRQRPKPEAPPIPSSVVADPSRSGAPPRSTREIAATQGGPTLIDSLPTPQFKRYNYRPAVRPQAGDRQKASELVTKGILAHRDRRAEEEINFYRSAVLTDPSNYDAYFNLGLASAETGDWATALNAYEQALNIDPDAANSRFNFAMALRQSDYPVDAAHELETILQTQPNDAKTLLALGNLYAQKFKQPRMARYYYLRLLEVEPNHPKAADVRFWLAANP